jgi:hypothetical protein
MQLQAREFKWGLSVLVHKWSGVKRSDVEWTDVIFVKWFCIEIMWGEVRYSEVLEDKYIKVTALYVVARMFCYVVVLLLCYFYYCVMCSLLA